MSAITPLVQKFKSGTFITFQSANRDLFLYSEDASRGFSFSKFMLLDVPDIETSINGQNTIQFNNIEGSFTNGLSSAVPPPEGDRIDLSESLQDYLLNFETLITNQDGHDINAALTVNERMFFKWLKEIGAIRYIEAEMGRNETSTTAGVKYVEEFNNNGAGSELAYDRVIRYIGEIDIVGFHKSNANFFREVYIYIPTQNGGTPVVLFKTVEDANYSPGKTIRKSGNLDIEYIAGRDESDNPTMYGLRVNAFYDSDVPLGSYDYLVNDDPLQPIWFQNMAANAINAYYTDESFLDPSTDKIIRTDPDTLETITYYRSRLDGVMVDFSKSDYAYFESHGVTKTFNEFNAEDQANSFEFNAIAIYYDVFDRHTGDVLATNLYGIYFINDLVVTSGSAAKIETLAKVNPSIITGESGNGFGFKINFKSDVTADSTISDIEVSVNDYNTFSMQLFTEAMGQVLLMQQNYEKVLTTNIALQQEIDGVKSLILTDTDKATIDASIQVLQDKLAEQGTYQDLLDLIEQNTKSIEEILRGNTTVDLTYSFDVIARNGLKAIIEQDALYLTNERQKYVQIHDITLDTGETQLLAKINVFKLGYADTLIFARDNMNTINNDIFIYIDDKENGWKNGQSVKFVLNHEILDDNGTFYSFIFYTDAINRTQAQSPYSVYIGSVNGKIKQVEIICIDSGQYKFIIV